MECWKRMNTFSRDATSLKKSGPVYIFLFEMIVSDGLGKLTCQTPCLKLSLSTCCSNFFGTSGRLGMNWFLIAMISPLLKSYARLSETLMPGAVATKGSGLMCLYGVNGCNFVSLNSPPCLLPNPRVTFSPLVCQGSYLY